MGASFVEDDEKVGVVAVDPSQAEIEGGSAGRRIVLDKRGGGEVGVVGIHNPPLP